MILMVEGMGTHMGTVMAAGVVVRKQKVMGVIHVIAAPGSDLEEVLGRVEELLRRAPDGDCRPC